jgi:hypothetical protein
MTMAARRSIGLAFEVVGWSLRFYWRHLGLVVGLSLIPAAQRAVSQLWGAALPGWAAPALEALTAVVRVVLFIAIFRLAIVKDDELGAINPGEGWQRIVRFVRREWPSVVVQAMMFAALLVVAEVVPDLVIAPRVPDDARPLYWATLLAIKNPTVIAFAMIWQVGAVRQALARGAAPTRSSCQ